MTDVSVLILWYESLLHLLKILPPNKTFHDVPVNNNFCSKDASFYLPFFPRSFQIIRIWDPRTCTKTMKLKGHSDNVKSVILKDDGTEVCT